MFFVHKMSSRPPYQTVETYIVNKTAFAEFCFSKLFSRSFVSNLVAILSRGTGLLDPSSVSQLEYESSLQATSQLTDAIFQQQMTLRIDDEAQSKTMKEIKHKKDVWFKELQSRIRGEVSESQAKIIDLASEKGASSWLTSLPLAKYGFVLNKQMFHDAICLRHNFALKLVARTCVCGEDYTINHCLTCKKGGYVILRHNSETSETSETSLQKY